MLMDELATKRRWLKWGKTIFVNTLGRFKELLVANSVL